MIKLNVKLDIAETKASLAGLEKEIDKAAMRALDRVATTVRKEAADGIGERLNLKKGTIKSGITKRAPFGKGRFVRDVEAKGSPVPIGQYAANQTRRGATYKVKRGGPRKVYRAKGNAGFIIDRYGRNVFVRTEPDPPGQKKGRIRKVFGPSITQYFVTRFMRNRMLTVAKERWPIEFAREVKFRKQRAAGLA